VDDALRAARHANPVLVGRQQLSGSCSRTADRDDRCQTVEQLAYSDRTQAVTVGLGDGHEPRRQQVLPGCVGKVAIEDVLQQRIDAEATYVRLDQRSQQAASPARRAGGRTVVAATDDALDLLSILQDDLIRVSGQPRQHRVSRQRRMQQLHRLSHGRLSEVGHGGGGVQRTGSASRVIAADQTVGPDAQPCHLRRDWCAPCDGTSQRRGRVGDNLLRRHCLLPHRSTRLTQALQRMRPARAWGAHPLSRRRCLTDCQIPCLPHSGSVQQLHLPRCAQPEPLMVK
jgi:hypothetical protein